MIKVYRPYDMRNGLKIDILICWPEFWWERMAPENNNNWAPSSEKVPPNTCKLRRFRPSCACAKSHPGLYSSLIHSTVSNGSFNGQRRSWPDCAHAQADLDLRFPHMPKDMFWHGATQLQYRQMHFLSMSKNRLFRLKYVAVQSA